MPYTNLDYLNTVTDGDSFLMKEMINLFISQIDEFTRNFHKFLEEKNWDALGKEAHKAKSSVLILGMNDLGRKLKDLQLNIENKEAVETYSDYITDFEFQTKEAIKELETIGQD